MNRFPSYQDLTCAEVQDTLEAYLDDELDADTSASIASHVESCATCQDEVRFAQAISGALHELPRPEPPPKIFDAVEAYVHAHPAAGQRWWHRIFQLSTLWDNLSFSWVHVGALACPVGIALLFTFWDNLNLAFVRAGVLVCLMGVVLFIIYQYQRYLKVKQASRDLYYALGKLNYAVARTGTVVSEKLPNVQINEASGRAFVQIETASRYASKQRKKISSAIHRSLENFNPLPENVQGPEGQHCSN
ncbi:hypothetical protein F4X90_20925 [Candidatus Poribacteria bacterium]|nr:hypothetical protein [Candidatus Poribacteria bacterium]